MAIIEHGATRDADYAEYARRRLAAFLRAAKIDARAVRIMEDDGKLHLGAVKFDVPPEDLENIPKHVDGLWVEVV